MKNTVLSAVLFSLLLGASGPAAWAGPGIVAAPSGGSHGSDHDESRGGGGRHGKGKGDEGRRSAPRTAHRGIVARQRAPAFSAAVVRDSRIAGDIRHRRAIEVRPGRSYWHTVGGLRYAHYYDRRYHWYGFYSGPNFYWTCLFRDRWWWYDTGYARWLFWAGGRWWWEGPGGGVYVYADGDYREPDEGATAPGDVPPPPTAEPAGPASSQAGPWKSPDGKRMVQVSGAGSEAFLYDTTGREPLFLKTLDRSVENVRFAGGTEGKPLRILVDRQDGTFGLYDQDGAPRSEETETEEPAPAVGPPPEVLPSTGTSN